MAKKDLAKDQDNPGGGTDLGAGDQPPVGKQRSVQDYAGDTLASSAEHPPLSSEILDYNG